MAEMFRRILPPNQRTGRPIHAHIAHPSSLSPCSVTPRTRAPFPFAALHRDPLPTPLPAFFAATPTARVPPPIALISSGTPPSSIPWSHPSHRRLCPPRLLALAPLPIHRCPLPAAPPSPSPKPPSSSNAPRPCAVIGNVSTGAQARPPRPRCRCRDPLHPWGRDHASQSRLYTLCRRPPRPPRTVLQSTRKRREAKNSIDSSVTTTASAATSFLPLPVAAFVSFLNNGWKSFFAKGGRSIWLYILTSWVLMMGLAVWLLVYYFDCAGLLCTRWVTSRSLLPYTGNFAILVMHDICLMKCRKEYFVLHFYGGEGIITNGTKLYFVLHYCKTNTTRVSALLTSCWLTHI